MILNMALGFGFLLLGFFVLFLAMFNFKTWQLAHTKHSWKYTSDGMYGELYECEKCGDTFMLPETQPVFTLPELGCKLWK